MGWFWRTQWQLTKIWRDLRGDLVDESENYDVTGDTVSQRNVRNVTSAMECDLECGRQNKGNYINARAPSLKLSNAVTTFEVRSKETHANWSLYVAVVYHRGTYTSQLFAEEFHRIFSRDHYCDCVYHWVIASWSSTICTSPAFSKGLILARRGLTPEFAPPC